MSISDQLRQAIENSGKTRYRIAKESGVSEAALSRFVRGETELSLSKVDAICELLGAKLAFDSPRARQGAKKSNNK